MTRALVLVLPLLLGGCWETALAGLGASLITRVDGYYDTRAASREVWLERGRQINQQAIDLYMAAARKEYDDGDTAEMKKMLDRALKLHKDNQPDLPIIPF